MRSHKKKIENRHCDSKPVAAALVASFVMLVFGVAYYAVASRLQGPAIASPVAPDLLEQLPLQIGNWIGQDIPMDEDIVRATDTDAHVSRRYSRQGGADSVTLFVGCGFSRYDQTLHRPEICYQRAGWTLTDEYPAELQQSGGGKLPCTILKCSRAGLQTERTTVLHYYIVDGQPYGNISLLESRLLRLRNSIGYVARMLIATSDTGLAGDSAEQVVSDFAVDSAPFIARLFVDLEKTPNLQNAEKTLEGK
jgi:EpsI family protein